jgi:hypothetical protein
LNVGSVSTVRRRLGNCWNMLKLSPYFVGIYNSGILWMEKCFHLFPVWKRCINTNQYIVYGGFHKYRYPNSWMVYFMENPNLKWMMTGGTPILGNLQMVNNMVDIYIYNDILSIMRYYDI